MGQNSHIEWTDHTFNPWIGCTKVSPGCANCYAATQDKFRKWTPEGWGAGKPRKRTSASNWNEPRKWDATTEMMRRAIASGSTPYVGEPYRRPRVFCASLADWLDVEVPIEWLADLLALIHDTPHLDWLLLTKRPQNWLPRLQKAVDENEFARSEPREMVLAWMSGTPPANVWIGTTVEDQQRADERIPELVNIPARVRFLSCEPLLGPVNLSMRTHRMEMAPGIHWVICGGESGPGARPMHTEWARSLRDQCAAAGVAFHFKQHGEWIARSQYLYAGNEPIIQSFLSGKEFASAVMRRDGGIDESLGEASTTNDSDSAIIRAGKKLAGRLLDGVEHNGFPAL